MKARIGLLVLILALSAALSVGQSLSWWTSPWAGSFRKASTAGLLEDDLDLMLDPARLPLIEGNRLYTNLSNLVGKNEYLFDNSGNEYYLIGGSGKIMSFGYGGLLYDRYLARHNDTTNVNYTANYDLDANGTYDRKVQVDSMFFTSTKVKRTDWWFGYGRELGPGRVGLLFYHSVSNTYGEPRQQTKKTTMTDLVLPSNPIVLEVDENTRIAQDFTSGYNGGALSYWYNFNDKIDLGLAGGINIYKNEQQDTTVYHLSSTNPSAGYANGTTIDSTALCDTVPYGHTGMDLIGRVAGIYKWSDQVKTRTDLYFTILLGGKKDDGYIKSNYHSNVAYQLISTNSSDINRVREGTFKQEDHAASVGLISNTFVKFSDKVEMAIGLGLESNNFDATNTYESPFNETTTYNDGDGNPAAGTDSTAVTTGSTKKVAMITENELAITTPVCVEFHITKPFVFRLGATHVFDYTSTTGTLHIEEAPRITKVYKYGVETDSKPTPFVSINGASTYDKTAESYLNYTYGAGWEISKNLQIDLMGFYTLDDMSNWKLSAVFKF